MYRCSYDTTKGTSAYDYEGREIVRRSAVTAPRTEVREELRRSMKSHKLGLCYERDSRGTQLAGHVCQLGNT